MFFALLSYISWFKGQPRPDPRLTRTSVDPGVGPWFSIFSKMSNRVRVGSAKISAEPTRPDLRQHYNSICNLTATMKWNKSDETMEKEIVQVVLEALPDYYPSSTDVGPRASAQDSV